MAAFPAGVPIVAGLFPSGARALLDGSSFRMLSNIATRSQTDNKHPSTVFTIEEVVLQATKPGHNAQPRTAASRVKDTDWTGISQSEKTTRNIRRRSALRKAGEAVTD